MISKFLLNISKIDIHGTFTYMVIFSRGTTLHLHLPIFVPSCCHKQTPTPRAQAGQ